MNNFNDLQREVSELQEIDDELIDEETVTEEIKELESKDVNKENNNNCTYYIYGNFAEIDEERNTKESYEDLVNNSVLLFEINTKEEFLSKVNSLKKVYNKIKEAICIIEEKVGYKFDINNHAVLFFHNKKELVVKEKITKLKKIAVHAIDYELKKL